jgi:hypothetical protein
MPAKPVRESLRGFLPGRPHPSWASGHGWRGFFVSGRAPRVLPASARSRPHSGVGNTDATSPADLLQRPTACAASPPQSTVQPFGSRPSARKRGDRHRSPARRTRLKHPKAPIPKSQAHTMHRSDQQFRARYPVAILYLQCSSQAGTPQRYFAQQDVRSDHVSGLRTPVTTCRIASVTSSG